MAPVQWERLATVFAAGGAGLLVTLLLGLGLVPAFRHIGFVSRESKQGVAQGRRDTVPMGGGFILLGGVTIVIALLTWLELIRRGYSACFLIAFWGFGLLGFLDDRSKVVRHGYSDKVKVLLQVCVTLAFAVSFYNYYLAYVSQWDLEYLTMPFLGEVPLALKVELGDFGIDLVLVPFVMLFLFWVSNAVNITDGFNGLAGGSAAVVTLAYAVVTFLIGASELSNRGETDIAIRMFALSRMSAVIGGSLIAYLYFNFCRGSIYFGDTGSMALGAALAFLAVFSRTEFLFCVIAGVFFTEAGSVALQKLSVIVTRRVCDPLIRDAGEPFRPFIIAPLHHHFEHLLMRELEGQGGDPAAQRAAVRRRITRTAWALGAVFAACGVVAAYGDYREWTWLYDWSCVAGVLFWCGILLFGVLTRFLYDSYFIGPDEPDGQLLTLYRGLPWRVFGRRWFHVYETTDVPVASLGYLDRRTGLFHLFFTRVDARVAFGLLHYQVAQRAAEPERGQHLRRALAFWSQVPEDRFLIAQRQEILGYQAEALVHEGRYAAAVRCLEAWLSQANDPAVLARLEAIQATALQAAEAAYARWTGDHECETARAAALASHVELHDLYRIRFERAQAVRQRLATRPGAAAVHQAVGDQMDLLTAALDTTTARIARLQPKTPEGDPAPSPDSAPGAGGPADPAGPLRVLLAGGGTAGHIYPLLSLAHHWRDQGQVVVRFVGEAGRMEADLLPREGFDLTLLHLPPANAPRWRKVLASPGWLRGWAETRRLLAEFQPDVVVGAGGQVCGPVLLAARRAGVPTVILEPNAIPGRANRLLARHARPALVGVLMPAARAWFPDSPVEELGYPIRPAILAAEREPSAAALGLDPAKTTVLVFGGSLGSGKINEAVVGLVPDLREAWAANLQILHLGGRVNARTVAPDVAPHLVVDYHYRAYLHEMEQALAAADLVVGRAGAMSLAELTARGLPAILVPLPTAADNHQAHNAAWMAEAGAAVVVPDAELTPARLGQELQALLADPARLQALAAASRKLGRPDAAALLGARIEDIGRARTRR